MVKVAHQKNNSPKIGTKVKKENSVQKVVSRGTPKHIKMVSRGTPKHIKMMHRRLSALLDEKASWEVTNRELMDSFNKEKKLNSELQKESFNWQRLYHDAVCSLNSYKVKHADMIQNLSSCVKDMSAYYPHIVAVTELMCRNKTRLTNQLTSLRTLEAENYIPRALDGGQTNNDLSKKSEKRMKHKVGPMVKGVLIQKPTIRLERVMLQQPQGQEPASNDLSPTGENDDRLPTIAEENDTINENLHLGQISIRHSRVRRLGSADRWRMRKKELEKERQIERERENQRRSVLEESSDSDDHLGPVLRLQRVSGLLLGRNLLEVDHGRASEGMGTTSRSSELPTHRRRPGEDPLEGCSWMNAGCSRHSKNKIGPEKDKPQSPATSDSSDEESDTLNVSQKKACSSFTEALYKDQSFAVLRKSSSSSSTTDTSPGASDSSKPEPDSTNNIDEVVSPRTSVKDSLSKNSSIASLVSVRKQLAFSDGRSGINRSQQEEEIINSQTTSKVTPLVPTDIARLSEDHRRSSFCNNCTPISSPHPNVLSLGKRIRKPKIHVYPGEESDNPKALESKVKKGERAMVSKNKVTNSRLSTARKSLAKSSTKNDVTSRVSSATSSEVSSHRSSQGRPSGSSQKKTVAKKSSTKKSLAPRVSSATSADISGHRTSQARPSSSSGKKVSKRSPVKKSLSQIHKYSNTVDQRPSQGQGDADRKSGRRIKTPISYKETSLNVKMRRPK